MLVVKQSHHAHWLKRDSCPEPATRGETSRINQGVRNPEKIWSQKTDCATSALGRGGEGEVWEGKRNFLKPHPQHTCEMELMSIFYIKDGNNRNEQPARIN